MIMKTLEVECTVDITKRTVWMNRLLSAFNNARWKLYHGTMDEMKGIRSGIECFIRQLRMSGKLNVELTTEITTDNALLVKKNGNRFITAYFV